MPQTNGIVERFNGRIASEILGINVAGHSYLEILLAGFTRAYNRRRQRVLQGSFPRQKVEEQIARDLITCAHGPEPAIQAISNAILQGRELRIEQ